MGWVCLNEEEEEEEKQNVRFKEEGLPFDASIKADPPPHPTILFRRRGSLQDFDFSDLFGPAASSPSSSSSLFLGDPQVIHHRSHSFVGPSPRFTLSKSLPTFEQNEREELYYSSSDDTANNDTKDEAREVGGGSVCGGDGINGVVENGGIEGVKKVGPADFEIMRVIGKGAFGKVFQTKSKLYLILDFINGGHLFYHLYRQGIFSEDQARVYTAEIVSAVSHLHKNGIVHRDLKPENILMDADGHVMLTDFGLAKEIDESSRSNSLCGTTEYMAPEILLSKGHNKNADLWSIGILLYEMLSGQPPYTHPNRKKLQEKIINEKLKLPPRLSSEAHSLLKGLLQKDPLKRLGSGLKGAEEIKSHKWFRTINWKKLEARELQPKFKPDVSGKDCTANFDRCWTAMPLDDSPAPTPTSGEHFHGYTYVAPNPWLSSE
ncbi:UNVERIFIED_CONTAM: Serine/threonine-protein kinase AtPK2/AtPK19 [Sesamum radiatum]|uniref:non-specific serine/threonine protein kinase n=1 Tax=Sesamum radiatum TaxID=300843 RepID=A0AAW2WHI2_SESRA